MEAARRPKTRQFRFRLARISFGEISIRQPQRDRATVRPRKLCLVEISFSQLEVVHRQKKIRSLRKIIRGHRRLWLQPRFCKSDHDLPPRFIRMTLPQEDLSDLEPHSKPISTRHI